VIGELAGRTTNLFHASLQGLFRPLSKKISGMIYAVPQPSTLFLIFPNDHLLFPGLAKEEIEMTGYPSFNNSL